MTVFEKGSLYRVHTTQTRDFLSFCSLDLRKHYPYFDTHSKSVVMIVLDNESSYNKSFDGDILKVIYQNKMLYLYSLGLPLELAYRFELIKERNKDNNNEKG